MAKTKDFWFKFYPQKWLAGTAFMTFEERGFYLHLLMLQHQSGHIPEKTVRFLLGSSSVSVWDTVSAKFVQDEHGNFYNEFLEEQIAERVKSSETNAANGNLGGRPPKAKTEQKPNGYDLGSENDQNKNRNETQTKTKSNSISISDNSIVEHPYNGGASVTISQGGAGGNGIGAEFFQALYHRFISAYGSTGRSVKADSIRRELVHAVRYCGENNYTPMEAATLICEQAKRCNEMDTQHGNKRHNPENWLAEKCYEANPDDIKPPPKAPEKLTPSQQSEIAIAKFKQEREERNGKR